MKDNKVETGRCSSSVGEDLAGLCRRKSPCLIPRNKRKENKGEGLGVFLSGRIFA